MLNGVMTEPLLRIVSWNIAHKTSAWDTLVRSDAPVDVALLQEAVPPPTSLPFQTIPGRDGSWTTAGGRRNFCAAVARISEHVRMTAVDSESLADANSDQVGVSRLGTLAAADIAIDGEEPITLVSLYGSWEAARKGNWIFADASVHRLVSDLSYFVGGQHGHRIIAAGDLNILHGYGESGSAYWGERYATIFKRMAAIGIPFVGPQHPNGSQAMPWPSELPTESKNVPTFRTRRTDPSSATRQLDFVFASEELVPRLQVRALNSEEEWGPSDHCRISIELR